MEGDLLRAVLPEDVDRLGVREAEQRDTVHGHNLVTCRKRVDVSTAVETVEGYSKFLMKNETAVKDN